ncbi:MAG: plasmid recombination protein, partial [Treponema sp.]|nr:plasmid recombination protein [Treponema sp.]
MANVRHFHRSAVRSILNHVTRIDNYSNKDIDSTRSKYNYSLTKHNPFEVYDKRLSEVHCLNRANVNTLSSWCVTLPKGVKKEDQRKFFEETVNFLKNRYGERNLVSADVHFDETTPHLHYCFIPIIYDEKKKREKVDRKSIFTLKELKTFHNDLQT